MRQRERLTDQREIEREREKERGIDIKRKREKEREMFHLGFQLCFFPNSANILIPRRVVL